VLYSPVNPGRFAHQVKVFPMTNIPADLDALRDAAWLNPPPGSVFGPDGLRVTTGDRTDFWQSTFYGFQRDDGHALLTPAPAEFSATVAFIGEYETLYDQAGLMLRADARNWVKAGIEFSDGMTNFSVVVTRDGRSDWSVTGVPAISGQQQLRLVRKGDAVLVHFLTAQGDWQHLRLADFPPVETRVGVMACSPQRAGFHCRFTAFRLDPPPENPLH
jgi:regulation of enolase protein 1 (concanavalin A-like superfamily)